MRRLVCVVAVLLTSACRDATGTRVPRLEGASTASADLLPGGPCTNCAFGPHVMTKAGDPPVVYEATFAADPGAAYAVVAKAVGQADAAVEVLINGVRVVTQGDMERERGMEVSRNVRLLASNRVVLRLVGAPGSTATVAVLSGAQVIGAAGGTIVTPGGEVTLSIPAGALAQATAINIAPSTNTSIPPSLTGVTALGPAWSLEPQGLTFALPAEITVDYQAVLGHVGSPREIGLVHVDDVTGAADPMGAFDNAPTPTQTAHIESFSRIVIVRTLAIYSLLATRWSMTDLVVSGNGNEYGEWEAETSGIRFVTLPNTNRNITINHVSKAYGANCPSGWPFIYDQTGVTCFPSLTRLLGPTDEVLIYISDVEFTNRSSTPAEMNTAIRHHIGHAIGIGHPYLNPNWVFFPPRSNPSLYPVMSRFSFFQSGFISPIARKFGRQGLHAEDIAAVRAKYGPLLPAPALVSPAPGSIVRQNDPASGAVYNPAYGYGARIDLDWTDIPSASGYQFRAFNTTNGVRPLNPFCSGSVVASQGPCILHNGFSPTSSVIEVEVRATATPGWTGPWSPPLPLNWGPCVLNDGTPCGTPHIQAIVTIGGNNLPTAPLVAVLNAGTSGQAWQAVVAGSAEFAVPAFGVSASLTLAAVPSNCVVGGGPSKPVSWFGLLGTATFTVTCGAPPSPESVDQSNDPPYAGSFSCPNGSTLSVFQSFTPARSPLSSVELSLKAGGGFPAAGTVTGIRIRAATPGGAVLATVTEFVPAPPPLAQVAVRFRLPQPLSVTLGSPLVIEWMGAGGPMVLGWITNSQDLYSGGSAFGCNGVDLGFDANFRTFTP